MKRSTLLLLLVIGLLAAACSTESELPVNDNGDQPAPQGACIETEPDCEDTVVDPAPLPPYDGTDQPNREAIVRTFMHQAAQHQKSRVAH